MMLTCKEVSKLVSESLEHKLSFGQRIGLWSHLMMCGMCRAYRGQIIVLRQILESYDALGDHGANEARLSDQARNAIRRRLREKARMTDADKPRII